MDLRAPLAALHARPIIVSRTLTCIYLAQFCGLPTPALVLNLQAGGIGAAIAAGESDELPPTVSSLQLCQLNLQ